ncbi:hypothetical protein LJE82_12575, partial [bacterium BMS3Abin03]|nr:hypothetical protein [bacterium BMS3Abin03]
MKIFFTSIFLFVLSINVFAQYEEVTIRDIQYLDSLLDNGDRESPLNGDTVTITGVVMVPPYISADPDSGVLMYCGSGSAGFFMQDTSETDWSGILAIQTSPISPDFQILDSGAVVKITGYVSEYYTTTEFFITSFDASNIVGFKKRPEPVELTLDSLKEIGTDINKVTAEKWEGVYVIIRNVTTTERNSSGGFRIFDSNNTKLSVGTKSNYYYNNTAPADGTVLDYIKGYIETRTDANGVTLNPGFRDDMKVKLYSPSVSNIVRSPVKVTYGQDVTITAQITDQDGTIDTAKLYYRVNNGTNNALLMINSEGNTWQAIIPGLSDSSVVDFFVYAVDNDNNKIMYPADTTQNRYFYLVLGRTDLTIQDIQFSPFGGGFSAFNGYEVTVSGVVTADISDIEGDGGSSTGPSVYLQNGTGPWSGIRIFGTETDSVVRGDNLTVTGPVYENYSVTQIGTTTSGAVVSTNSTSNSLPDPESLSTSEIDEVGDGTVQAEQWEGVLVQYNNVTVTDENADGDPGPAVGGNNNYGEMFVADESNQSTRVELQVGTHHYDNFWEEGQDTVAGLIRIKDGYTFEALKGILFYSHSYYKLMPRKDDDFVGLTDIKQEKNIPTQYNVSQNYPNPFNPSTKIQYTLPVEGNVILKIYNILGKEVKTLI